MNLLETLARWAGLDSDTPQPFGYKQSWLAISADHSAAVAHALGMRHTRPCTWATGTQPNHEGLIFIAPPIRGWVFVIGLDDLASDDQFDSCITQLIEPLSAQFGVAHFFATHRVVEFHCWARAEGGALVRGYAYLGESGETLWDTGTPQFDIEQDLPPIDFEEFDETAHPSPDEELVMELARRWCIAPCDLSPTDGPTPRGLLGAWGSAASQ